MEGGFELKEKKAKFVAGCSPTGLRNHWNMTRCCRHLGSNFGARRAKIPRSLIIGAEGFRLLRIYAGPRSLAVIYNIFFGIGTMLYRMNDQNVVMDRAEDSGEFSSLSLFAFTCRGREKWIRMPSVQMQFSLVLLVLKNSFNKLPKYPDTNYVFPAAFFFLKSNRK